MTDAERLQEHLNERRTGQALRMRALEGHAASLAAQAQQATGEERETLAQDALAAYLQLFRVGRRI